MAPKRQKYNAKRVEVDGIVFDSIRESKRWILLRAREAAGEIERLERQVPYPLHVNGEPVVLRSKQINKDGRERKGRQVVYWADFRYLEPAKNRIAIEDSKGFDTPASAIKRAVVEAIYGLRIDLV